MNNNLVLFYDGCHKIYYAERSDNSTVAKMQERGYEVIDGNFSHNLQTAWQDSCLLRFVEPADLDFDKPHVFQFQTGGLRGFRTTLARYYKNQQ